MAIVKMKKFTLFTFDSYKNELLKEFQKFELVHFKNLQKDEASELEFLRADDPAGKITALENEYQKVRFAVNMLQPYVEKPKGIKALTALPPSLNFREFDEYVNKYDYSSVYDRLKKEDEIIISAKTEIAKKASENETLKQWLQLDISAENMRQLKTSAAIIGSISKSVADSFKETVEAEFPMVHIEYIGAIKDDILLLTIIHNEVYEDTMNRFKVLGFTRVNLNFQGVPSELIKNNEASLKTLESERQKSIEAIKALNSEYDRLMIVLDYFNTALEREKARGNFVKTSETIVIDGWVPSEDSDEFKRIVGNVCGDSYYIEEFEVEKDSEDVPIKLKNNKLVSAFEEVTSMYSMPKYNEIDPTPVLTPFYMLFFGFMVGDIGYGLVLMLGTAAALKFLPLKEGAKKFIQFFFYLSIAVFFAGFIYGGFFGYTVVKPLTYVNELGAVEYKAILDSQMDIVTMLIMSIAFGVIQIIYGLLVKGYMLCRDGKVLDAVFDSLFWIITLLSAIGMLLGAVGILSESAASTSKWGFIGGVVGLALTQGRESPGLGGKLGNGLYAVYGLSSYVGDFVSYTRIVALALSGAYIAFSFNLMVDIIPSGIPRILFGSVVFIIGQSLNLGLALLGAYVHTCRLQYVEFFSKFYEGGGVPFSPLKLKNNYINLTK